jgi:hypothetical protein
MSSPIHFTSPATGSAVPGGVPGPGGGVWWWFLGFFAAAFFRFFRVLLHGGTPVALQSRLAMAHNGRMGAGSLYPVDRMSSSALLRRVASTFVKFSAGFFRF